MREYIKNTVIICLFLLSIFLICDKAYSANRTSGQLFDATPEYSYYPNTFIWSDSIDFWFNIDSTKVNVDGYPTFSFVYVLMWGNHVLESGFYLSSDTAWDTLGNKICRIKRVYSNSDGLVYRYKFQAGRGFDTGLHTAIVFRCSDGNVPALWTDCPDSYIFRYYVVARPEGENHNQELLQQLIDMRDYGLHSSFTGRELTQSFADSLTMLLGYEKEAYSITIKNSDCDTLKIYSADGDSIRTILYWHVGGQQAGAPDSVRGK